MLEAAWLIPALPLAGFVLLVFFGRRIGEPLAGWIATSAIGGSFLATLVVFIGLVNEQPNERFFIQKAFTWVAAGTFSVDVGFLVDPLSITMCLFVTGIGTLIHLYSIGYMHGDENYARFFTYLNLFAASMLLLVLGDNLLMTFLGWEGVGACSYLLISFWFTKPENASAGKKAFVTNRVGDFGFMLATFLIFSTIGSIRYADIITAAEGGNAALTTGIATAAVALFMLAAAGKSAQIPLFVWLPDAMAGPTPVSALIHAATMVTSGVYLLVRLNPLLEVSSDNIRLLIAFIGAITGLVAALAAVVQNDIKKVLAYSTVSQLGYLFLAVGIGAYVPAMFHMITHAFFKALLFLGSGSVIHGMHDEQDMRRYGALHRFMPITAGTFIVGWLAIAGVPPFSGFWSKDEILLYAWSYDGGAPIGKVLWLIGLVTAILTAFYMTRQVILTFGGDRTRYFDAKQEEIATAFENRVQLAVEQVTVAKAGAVTAAEALEKAKADIAKREGAIGDAETKLHEAQAAVSAANEEDDGFAKLVKAFEKAEKAGPKAEDALATARQKVSEATEAVGAAEAARVSASEAVLRARTEMGQAPVVPKHVTALTPAPDVSGFEAELPDSYRERQEYHPHESPWTMTLPLVVLAGLAFAGGGLNLPFTHNLKFLENWLTPSLYGNEVHVGTSTSVKYILAVIAVCCALSAIAFAAFVYLKGRRDPATLENERLALAVDYDIALAKVMGGPGTDLFNGLARVDSDGVDGGVNGIAKLITRAGTAGRAAQSGLVRSYALGISVGAVVLVAWFLGRLFS